MEYSKERQAPAKKKDAYKIPQVSAEQADHNERVRKAKEIAIEEQGGVCKETGQASFDCSHNWPEKHFKWLADDPRNITLLRRDKHQAWEGSRFHELENSSYTIFKGMVSLLMEQKEQDKADRMHEHLMNKLYKSIEAAKSAGVKPLDWVVEILKSI